MEIVVKFGEKDSTLIEKIKEYQMEENLTFDDAVKSLCARELRSLMWEEFK